MNVNMIMRLCGHAVDTLVCFAACCYAGTIYSVAVCLPISPSIASQCSIKMADHRITQAMSHDSLMILVFWCQKSLQNSR